MPDWEARSGVTTVPGCGQGSKEQRLSLRILVVVGTAVAIVTPAAKQPGGEGHLASSRSKGGWSVSDATAQRCC